MRFIRGLRPAGLGHHADVAKFHAELVVGRAGLRVVGSPSVVAEGLKPCEDFIDGHADDYTRNSKQANDDRRISIPPAPA
jgi:hypothetical protein